MFFLRKAAVVDQEVRSFVFLHTPKTYKDPGSCLRNIEESPRLFAVGGGTDDAARAIDERPHA